VSTEQVRDGVTCPIAQIGATGRDGKGADGCVLYCFMCTSRAAMEHVVFPNSFLIVSSITTYDKKVPNSSPLLLSANVIDIIVYCLHS